MLSSNQLVLTILHEMEAKIKKGPEPTDSQIEQVFENSKHSPKPPFLRPINLSPRRNEIHEEENTDHQPSLKELLEHINQLSKNVPSNQENKSQDKDSEHTPIIEGPNNNTETPAYLPPPSLFYIAPNSISNTANNGPNTQVKNTSAEKTASTFCCFKFC
jgi:hypothetical protein